MMKRRKKKLCCPHVLRADCCLRLGGAVRGGGVVGVASSWGVGKFQCLFKYSLQNGIGATEAEQKVLIKILL